MIHNTAIIGHGYWGSKIANRIDKNTRFNLKYIADPQPVDANYKDYKFVDNINTILDDLDVKLVGIFTPPNTHYNLMKQALQHGKHIYTTKPFVTSSSEAYELLQIANNKGLKIFVDYTYLFSPIIRKIKCLLDNNISYIEFANANRWTGRGDPGVSPITDLIPHILSILYYWLDGDIPAVENISRISVCTPNDMAYIKLRMQRTGIPVMLTLGWAYPYKERRNIIVGPKKMITFDTSAIIKVQNIHNDGVKIITDNIEEFSVGGEPLQIELEEIADCLDNISKFIGDGNMALAITSFTEIIENS